MRRGSGAAGAATYPLTHTHTPTLQTCARTNAQQTLCIRVRLLFFYCDRVARPVNDKENAENNSAKHKLATGFVLFFCQCIMYLFLRRFPFYQIE